MRFFIWAVGLVGGGLLLLLPLLDSESLRWVAIAGAASLVAQGSLYVGLARWRRDPKSFFKAVIVGAVVRLGLIVAGIVWVALDREVAAVPFLVGLAGFLFVLLMVEAILENSNALQNNAAKNALGQKSARR